MRLIQMYLSDLKELLAAKEFVSLRSALKEISPVDLVDGWEHFGREERPVLFRLMPRQRALQLFEELDPEHQEELLGALKAPDIEELVEDLDPAETGRLLRGLPKPLVRQLEAILRKGSGGARAAQVASYPEKSVGALMRTRYLTLSPRWTCREALSRVSASTRLRLIENTYLDTLFAVDASDRFAGTVTLKELVVAPADMPVSELVDGQAQALLPELDQEEAARIFHRYRLACAAVVDGERRILGVVLDADMDEVTAEETEEDIAKMAGTRAGLLDEPVWRMTWVRSPWLLATCGGYILVSKIIQHYEPVLAHVIALASFMPLIAAMGGNVGAQTATIIVRGLATGEVEMADMGRVCVKETCVGALLGTFYGCGMALVSYMFYGQRLGFGFSAVVGIGMAVSTTTAAAIGSLEPFIFHRLRIDPATATGPLITCIADMVSTATYLTVASALLMRI